MSQPNSPTQLVVKSPAVLPLGTVKNNGQPALVGITLLYPPIEMVVKPLGELSVTGGRAPVARAQALKWFESHNQPPKAEIEIELAIPAHMGLGSDALMGLSVAYGLAGLSGADQATDTTHTVDIGAEWSLEANCQSQGGLQVVNLDGSASRRQALKHDEKNAWVFVLYMPRTTNQTPANLEHAQRLALVQAAQTVQTDVEPLWGAVVADDIEAFARELTIIQEQTAAALAQIGAPVILPEESERVLEAISKTGGLAYGQSFGGMALWGLFKGAATSQEARMLMRRVVGYEGGTVTAAITDNRGVTVAAL
jgi:beta-ribofuranosylaminobenzene 5'-phosphate synthase